MTGAAEQVVARALDALPAMRQAALEEWAAHRATAPTPPRSRASFLVGYARGWFARNRDLEQVATPAESKSPQLFTNAMVNHGYDARTVVSEWHDEAGHAGTVWSCREQPCHAVEAVSR